MKMNPELQKLTKQPQLAIESKNNETTKLTMYGRIGTGWYADISSKNVQEMLNQISGGVIELHVSSVGGDVFESLTINNMLKNHPASIEVHIDGIAASGMSLIVMAADKIIMPSNTMMMIHQAATIAYGNANDFEKMAEDLKQIDTAVTQSYLNRFTAGQDKLKELLQQETYLTAENCLSYGLCDEIADELNETHDRKENVMKVIENRVINNQERFAAFVNATAKTFKL